jgi:transcriptional regulator with PAS, ATPase and Fis domain
VPGKKYAAEIIQIVEKQKISVDEIMDSIDKYCILKALLLNKNNRSKTARFLGLKRTTLIERMRRYKIL